MSNFATKGPRAPKSKAKPPDLIVPISLTCPCGCNHTFTKFVPILVKSELVYETDEVTGSIKFGKEGLPIPKTRISHEYKSVPIMHPNFTPEMEEEYRILYDRAEREREQIRKAEEEYARKHPKPEILAEVAA